MKIALSWLKRYIDLSQSVEELSDLLTFAGIEVEGIERIPALPQTVIAAKVLSAERVPKTDHLNLCKVEIGDYDYEGKAGDNTIEVICGAPNCHSGMMAVLALPGSKLGELEIKVAKIRGIVSNGMLCSERELGLSDNHAGIIELPDDTPIGTSVNELYELEDTVFELEITPNRSDLLGYMGIARDLAAKLNLPIREPELKVIPAPEEPLELGLYNEEPVLCPRYTARVIRNVQIAPSPLWLKSALIKSGLRPINNVVDITNYVMLELGHPLHAFDYDKLAGRQESTGHPDILIRKAQAKEEILALDGRSYILSGEELVIADGKRASAIAGVMGSEYSGITLQSKNIVLESAAFHPGSIRKTSYNLKLSSDSSYRFERHLAAEYADRISARATAMILDLAGGQVSSELLDSYPDPLPQQFLAIRPARFWALIGFRLSDEDIKSYLQKLGFEFQAFGRYQKGLVSNLEQLVYAADEKMQDDQYAHYYLVPAYRKDMSREADLLEELARLAGYDRVPQRTVLQQIMDRHAYRIRNKVTDWLVSWGACETLNYSFCDPRQMQDLGYALEQLPLINLVNPQSSNQSVMRVSLVPQLLNNLAYNLNHSERNVKLFEQAKVYLKSDEGHSEPTQTAAVFTGLSYPEHWQTKAAQIDFAWTKGCFEGLLQLLGIEGKLKASSLPYHVEQESFCYESEGAVLGSFGRIKPAVLAQWGIDSGILKQDVWILEYHTDLLVEHSRKLNLQYRDISKYPAVVRDLSFLAPDAVAYAELEEAILRLDPQLMREVQLFDEYRSKQIPEGFRSLSLHIVLQDQEKTLTDERVEQLMDSVQKTLIEKYEIRMR